MTGNVRLCRVVNWRAADSSDGVSKDSCSFGGGVSLVRRILRWLGLRMYDRTRAAVRLASPRFGPVDHFARGGQDGRRSLVLCLGSGMK